MQPPAEALSRHLRQFGFELFDVLHLLVMCAPIHLIQK